MSWTYSLKLPKRNTYIFLCCFLVTNRMGSNSMMLWWSELDLQKPVGPNDCESLSSMVSTILPLPSEDQIYLILSGKIK